MEISRALNNNFQADCIDLFRFFIGLSKVMKVFCFVFVWGIMESADEIVLLRHKVGLCLHGHIYHVCI